MTNRVRSRVCVLLATYNGEGYLEQQLASILWQVGVDVEVFVRDDGSTDGTMDLIRAACARESRIHLVSDNAVANTGLPTKAFFRLFGLVDFSSFDFVALADQDDVWLPDKLSRLIDAVDGSGADGCSSNLFSFSESGFCSLVRKTREVRELDYLFQGASAGCTYLLSREFAQRVAARFGHTSIARDLPRNASHDWLIYALSRGCGGQWVMTDYPSVLYRQHARNVYGARGGFSGFVSRVKMLRSGWLFENVLFLQSVVQSSVLHQRVFSAVRRLRFRDRIWLAANAHRFRRESSSVIVLACYFLFGSKLR